MKNMKYIKNVVSLELDSDKCTGCGLCTEVCPHGVFELRENKAVIVDKDLCMECGACEKNCKPKAISVKPGVGCAAAVIFGALKGTEPTCGCSAPGDKDNNDSRCC